MKKQKEIIVPSSADDITLGVYQKIVTSDEALRKDPYYILALLCNVDPQFIKKIKDKDVLKMMQIAEGALSFKQNKFRPFWTHDKTKYGYHPNLEEMTLGEITDFENYMNDPEEYHKAMAVCFRPVVFESGRLKGLYEIEAYTGTQDRIDVMRNIPLSYFFGVRTFFLTIGKELRKVSLRYSTQPGATTPI